jgi:hypothetical protein
MNTLRHFLAWLASSRRAARADEAGQNLSSASALDIDPMWHGDHWQNLLSSPMDARHYVMEDWSASADFESLSSGFGQHAH